MPPEPEPITTASQSTSATRCSYPQRLALARTSELGAGQLEEHGAGDVAAAAGADDVAARVEGEVVADARAGALGDADGERAARVRPGRAHVAIHREALVRGDVSRPVAAGGVPGD